MTKFCLLFSCLTLLSGCAGTQPLPSGSHETTQAKPICEILSNPIAYDGGYVAIQGTYLEEPHNRVLFDPKCPVGEIVLKPSFTYDDPASRRTVRAILKRDPIARISVIYAGVIRVYPVILGCTKSSCFKYQLEEARLMGLK